MHAALKSFILFSLIASASFFSVSGGGQRSQRIAQLVKKWKCRAMATTQVPKLSDFCPFLAENGTQSMATPPVSNEVVDKIVSIDQKCFNQKNISEDFRLLVGSSQNWETLLVPAPLALGYLGQTMLMSTQVLDFNINEKSPTGGFKYIRHPGSFRATLLQISSKAYAAFSSAHSNMKNIGDSSQTMSSYIEYVAKRIGKGQPLRPILRHIRWLSDSCVKSSDQVVKSFDGAMELLNEVLEATTSSTGNKEDQVFQLDDQRLWKESVKNISIYTMNMLDDDYGRLARQIRRYIKDLQKAEEEKIEASGIAAVEIVLNIFSVGLYSLATTSETVSLEDIGVDSDDCLPSRELMGELRTCIHYFQGRYKEWSEKKRPYKSEDQKTNFETVWKNLTDCDSVIIKQNLTALIDILKEAGQNDTLALKQLSKANDMMKPLLTLSEEIYNSGTITNASENKTQKTYVGSPGERALDIAEMKIRLARKMLDQAVQQRKQNEVRMIKEQEKYGKTLIELQQIDMKTLSLKESIDVLKKGLASLSIMKSHWSGLTVFFKDIANLMEVQAMKYDSTIKYVNETEGIGLRNQVEAEILAKQLFKAKQGALLFADISGMYVEISKNHLMKMIISQDKRIVLLSNGSEVEREEKKLFELCRKASDGIKEIIQRRTRGIVQQVASRQQELEEMEQSLSSLI